MESVAKLQILLRFGGSSAARPDKGMARESAGIGISQRTPGWGETFRTVLGLDSCLRRNDGKCGRGGFGELGKWSPERGARVFSGLGVSADLGAADPPVRCADSPPAQGGDSGRGAVRACSHFRHSRPRAGIYAASVRDTAYRDDLQTGVGGQFGASGAGSGVGLGFQRALE